MQFWEKVKKASDKRLFDIQEDGLIVPQFTVGVGL
jgi:hypothetical protein